MANVEQTKRQKLRTAGKWVGEKFVGVCAIGVMLGAVIPVWAVAWTVGRVFRFRAELVSGTMDSGVWKMLPPFVWRTTGETRPWFVRAPYVHVRRTPRPDASKNPQWLVSACDADGTHFPNCDPDTLPMHRDNDDPEAAIRACTFGIYHPDSASDLRRALAKAAKSAQRLDR